MVEHCPKILASEEKAPTTPATSHGSMIITDGAVADKDGQEGSRCLPVFFHRTFDCTSVFHRTLWEYALNI